MSKVSDLPVMKACCQTCPFKEINGKMRNSRLVSTITEETLFKSQHICHSTEQGDERTPTHRCRGSYDHNVTIYKRMGLDVESLMENYTEPLQ